MFGLECFLCPSAALSTAMTWGKSNDSLAAAYSVVKFTSCCVIN